MHGRLGSSSRLTVLRTTSGMSRTSGGSSAIEATAGLLRSSEARSSACVSGRALVSDAVSGGLVEAWLAGPMGRSLYGPSGGTGRATEPWRKRCSRPLQRDAMAGRQSRSE